MFPNLKPPEGSIDLDRGLPCVACGYDLRSLQTSGRCPDCGAEVSRSLEGDWLRYADPGWVKSLYIGVRLLAVSNLALWSSGLLWSAAMLGLSIISINPTGVPQKILALIMELSLACLFASALALLAGVWAFTRQEPRDVVAEAAFSSRRVGRGSMITGSLLIIAIFFPSPHLPTRMTLYSLGLSLVLLTVACLQHLNKLACRIPSESIVSGVGSLPKKMVRTAVVLLLLILGRQVSTVIPSFPASVSLLLQSAVTISALVLLRLALLSIRVFHRAAPVFKEIVRYP